MRVETKTVYISNDNNEFENEVDCLKWENRKFKKNLINLTNEEIIKLISIIQPQMNGEDVDITVRLEISSESISANGFTYRLTIASKVEGYAGRYEGLVNGYNDFELTHGDTVENNEWIANCGYSLKEVYQYLESIHYWDEIAIEPIDNPDITHEWKVIYERSIKGDKKNYPINNNNSSK